MNPKLALKQCAGPERLKEALATLGLKSGGTAQQRAERLFLTKDTPLDQASALVFQSQMRWRYAL